MVQHCPVIRASAAAGEVVVQAVTARAVRIRFFGPPVVAEASYVERTDWPDVPSADRPAGVGGEQAISTGRIAVAVDTTGGRFGLAVHDATGRRLFGTSAVGAVAREEAVDGATGDRRGRVVLQLQRTRNSYDDDVHFYGLGQGGGMQLDRIGTSRLFWNSQVGHGSGVDFGVPLLVASGPIGSYGLFFDTTAMARLDTARGSGGLTIRYEAEAPTVDLYVVAGPTSADVLEGYAELTGYPAMPPKWALGFLQSTRFFPNTAALLDVARTMRAKELPCDALIFLSTYGTAMGWNGGVGKIDFHPVLWSDPAAILGTIQDELGFRTVTHEYPVLHPDAPQFAEAERRGFLLDVAYPAPAALPTPTDQREATHQSQRYAEDQRFIDFTNPDARAWWWEQHRHLIELGVAGWWLDGGEGPSGPAPLHRGDVTLMHNAFDLYRFRAFAEGEWRDRPDGRPWMLCRSGAAGMQRFGAGSWTGDINTTFTTFACQPLLGLGLAMSGVPYWGTDIGGFYPNALNGELYARWFQFGAFSPIFRAHGWEVERHLPWAHGPEVEAICKRYLELRMRLLPYIYNLAREAHRHGRPIMRPLAFHYPADPNVWELGGQYLFGPDLLVAPVTQAGATHWSVYLPAGAWYDFWSGRRHEGGQAVSVAVPLDTVPLFARGGSIIPLGPTMQRTGERPLDILTLLVYPGAHGESGACTIYEDDGVTQAHRRGAFAETVVTATFDDGAARVAVGATTGSYAGQPDARDLVVRIRYDGRPDRVRVRVGGDAATEVGQASSAATGPSWDWEDEQWATVRLPAMGIRQAVTIEVSGEEQSRR